MQHTWLTRPAPTTQIERRLVRRFIMCPYLAQRLKAIQFLQSLCQDKRAVGATRHGQMTQAGFDAAAALCKWMKEAQIVESLLGEKVNGVTFGTHIEIVKQLRSLLTNMARFATVDNSVFDLLWALLADARPGDNMTRAVYDLTARLARELPVEQVRSAKGCQV